MSPLARLLTWVVRGYRRFVSPLFGRHCRFEPTCSAYALEALREYGAIRGLALTVRRLARCQPWNAGGFDPVPVRHPRKVA